MNTPLRTLVAATGKPTPRKTGEGRLPGDLEPRTLVERILRVDHAGEYGAKRIYEGQLAVLRRRTDPASRRAQTLIRHMAAQENAHLEAFQKMLPARRVRPTALLPLWHVAGFALGAATAALGPRAAMACTVAVEEVIDAHYAAQSAQLGDDEAELRSSIEKFRGEEVEHHDTAVEEGGRDVAGYPLLSSAVKLGSRLAIWLSERA
jgi:ubiquinone biosynthesis monooxygenase Coq7